MELSNKTPYKILVVDDNPDNIQVIGNMLRESGYSIGFATNGRQALTLLGKSSDYDLILLDVDMPVLNGYETCRIIRSTDVLKEIPVIFLTAFADMENKIIGFEAGAQDYVTKPYHAHELLSRVKTHAELSRSRSQLKEVNQWLEAQVKEKTHNLEVALTELNRLDKMKTNFLYQMSEELKNPLNGILGTVNLVKHEDRSSAVKDMIDILEISLSRLENFVSKAVLSTQLSAKDYHLHITTFNLNELVKYSILEQNNVLQNKNQEVALPVVDSPVVLNADKELVFKAINYLVENAAKYSPPGSLINIDIHQDTRSIILSVADHGPGFADDVLKSLFSLFGPEQGGTKSSSGISLQIIKQIMGLHKGEIKIENTKDGGAIIQLIFNLFIE